MGRHAVDLCPGFHRYDDRKEPEVLGLRCALLRKDVVAMSYLLCNVLHIVNGLFFRLKT